MTQEDDDLRHKKEAHLEWLEYQVRSHRWPDRITYLLKMEREATSEDINRLILKQWEPSSDLKGRQPRLEVTQEEAALSDHLAWLEYQVRSNRWPDRITYLLKMEMEETSYSINNLRWELSNATKQPTIMSKVIAGLKSVLVCLKLSGKK